MTLRISGVISLRILLFVLALTLAFGSGNSQTDSIPSEPDSMDVAEPMATGDNVQRSTFTTEVVDREPVDEIDSLSTRSDRVYFFTEIVDFKGGSITHHWIYGGETMAEVEFDVGGPRWRVYSIKNLMATQTGEWTVEVIDGHGNVVKEATLVYY